MRQLEVFLAVARAGSFRRAADGLHLSQPALSQHVGELERGLGARFFDRRGRTVTLTEAGRILEDHALRLFATLAGAREAIAELDGVGRGTLVVGASTTPGIYLHARTHWASSSAHIPASRSTCASPTRASSRSRYAPTSWTSGWSAHTGSVRVRNASRPNYLDELVLDRAADPSLGRPPPSRPVALWRRSAC